MPLLGLVRRVLAQAQNKRLLKRMGDRYVDIRMSSATQRASQCSSNASPVASRLASSQNSPSASASSSDTTASCAISSSGSRDNIDSSNQTQSQSQIHSSSQPAAVVVAPRSSTVSRANNNSSASVSSSRRGSQSRLSVSVCVVVPVQSAEAFWIDKLRAQEETYRRSVSRASHCSGNGFSCYDYRASTESNRRRCESEDDSFELWDYVCPQFVRPQLANEWV